MQNYAFLKRYTNSRLNLHLTNLRECYCRTRNTKGLFIRIGEIPKAGLKDLLNVGFIYFKLLLQGIKAAESHFIPHPLDEMDHHMLVVEIP